MRIIVISDTHGIYSRLSSVVTNNKNADMFIHLGDCNDECHDFLQSNPEYREKFHMIKGNCDYGSHEPVFKIIEAAGHRIFATHGHRYAVNFDLGTIITTAEENECDIILFGHTHVQLSSYQDGKYILNPGSASCPRDGKPASYGFIDITDTGVITGNAPVL